MGDSNLKCIFIPQNMRPYVSVGWRLPRGAPAVVIPYISALCSLYSDTATVHLPSVQTGPGALYELARALIILNKVKCGIFFFLNSTNLCTGHNFWLVYMLLWSAASALTWLGTRAWPRLLEINGCSCQARIDGVLRNYSSTDGGRRPRREAVREASLQLSVTFAIVKTAAYKTSNL